MADKATGLSVAARLWRMPLWLALAAAGCFVLWIAYTELDHHQPFAYFMAAMAVLSLTLAWPLRLLGRRATWFDRLFVVLVSAALPCGFLALSLWLGCVTAVLAPDKGWCI